jgi:hypothetical protein
MSETLSKALALTMLQHGEDFPWRMQDIGLMSLRLDDRREYRLHVWDPSYCVGEPPVHDHPYDLTSTIIAGEMANARYEVDPQPGTVTAIRCRWVETPELTVCVRDEASWCSGQGREALARTSGPSPRKLWSGSNRSPDRR